LAETETKTGGRKQRGVEEARLYAVGHRIRIEVLAMLHEGARSPSELAKLIGLPMSTLTHHVDELVNDDSIELAKVEKVRNTNEHFYRAVRIPFYSDEEMWAMSPETRQATYGLILQSAMAEALAAFWAGKMTIDPRVWMSWCWFNVDAQGREDIADELARSWARIQEIETESTTRRIQSGEDAISIIVTTMGFMRSRTSLTPPSMCQEKGE
jgi:DNA-binding transcriptional ArsR family regulator